MSEMPGRARGLGVTIGVILAAVLLAACGSSDSGGSTESEASSGASAAVTSAKAAVAKAEAPVESWSGPTSSPSPAKGKNVYVINCSTAAEGCLRLDAATMEAIEAIGWQGTLLKTDGSLTEYNAAVRQAVDRGADGIILDAIAPSVVKQSVVAAEQAGVPVVSNVSGETLPSSSANFKGGFFTEVDADNGTMGQLAADWAISATDGKANIGTFVTPDFPVIEKRVEAFDAEMAKCSTCETPPPVVVPVTAWESEGPGSVAQFIRANPDTNYFFSTADAPVPFVAQGISTAGATGKIPIVSTEGNAPNIEMIKEGGPEVAVAASPLEWDSWASVDQMNRAFAGQPPAQQWEPGGGGIPVKLITENNLPSTKTWSGDLDYEAEFEKLWGVGS
jgi:ribose transport system substrate-binding protein